MLTSRERARTLIEDFNRVTHYGIRDFLDDTGFEPNATENCLVHNFFYRGSEVVYTGDLFEVHPRIEADSSERIFNRDGRESILNRRERDPSKIVYIDFVREEEDRGELEREHRRLWRIGERSVLTSRPRSFVTGVPTLFGTVLGAALGAFSGDLGLVSVGGIVGGGGGFASELAIDSFSLRKHKRLMEKAQEETLERYTNAYGEFYQNYALRVLFDRDAIRAMADGAPEKELF